MAASVLTNPNDRYRFMGATPMPSLSASNELHNGVWCVCCYGVWRDWDQHVIHPGDDDSYQPGSAVRMMVRRDRRAFDKDEFVEHVRHECTAARRWARNRKALRLRSDPGIS